MFRAISFITRYSFMAFLDGTVMTMAISFPFIHPVLLQFIHPSIRLPHTWWHTKAKTKISLKISHGFKVFSANIAFFWHNFIILLFYFPFLISDTNKIKLS
jgi:hypothetical protein